MRPGKLGRPLVEKQVLTQGIRLENQNINFIQPEINTNQLSDGDRNRITSILLSDIMKENAAFQYNQILDEKISKSAKNFYEESDIKILRQRNRDRLAALTVEIENIDKKIKEKLRNSSYNLEYDVNNTKQKDIMDFLFPDHTPGIANSEQIQEVRDRANAIEKIVIKAKSDKSVKKIPRTQGLESWIENDLYGIKKISPRLQLEGREFAAKHEKLNERRSYGLEIFFTEETIKETYYAECLSNLTTNWDGEEPILRDDNITTDLAYRPLATASNNLRTSIGALGLTLSTVDEQNSYVDNMMGKKEPIALSVKGRNFKFEYDDVWSNCFDCFFEGGWKNLGDTKFSISAEFDASALLDQLDFLLNKLKYALDIEYTIKQNYCSLSRLGTLCPIELAFILGNLICLVRFVWQENIVNFKDLMFQLLASLILPLLNGVKASMKFSYTPFNIYFDCTSKSLKKVSEAAKIFADVPNGWTFEEILAAKTTGATSSQSPRTSALIAELQKIESGPLVDRESFLAAISSFKTEVKNKDTETMKRQAEDLGKSSSNSVTDRAKEIANQAADPKIRAIEEAMEKVAKANNPETDVPEVDVYPTSSTMVNVLTSPFFLEKSDVTGVFDIVMKEVASYVQSMFESIGISIGAIQGFATQNITSNIDIGAKLMALNSLISLVGALIELATKGINVCIPMPVYDKDGNQIGFNTETPFSPEELIDIIESTDFNNPQNQSGRVPDITYSNQVDESKPGYIYNPVTDRRFTLVKCDQAKSSIISKGESLEFWKRLALGANLDNV
jgi:hypothetical protein